MSGYRQWQAAFAGLKLAERRLLFIAALILLPYLFVLWLLEPSWQLLQRQQQQQQQQLAQLAALDSQNALIQQTLQQDPNQHLQQQLLSEQQARTQLSAQIRQLTGRYVAAEQMLTLLQDVLAQSPGVRLQQMSSKSAEPIQLGSPPAVTAAGSANETSAAIASNGTQQTALLYRHITVLTFSGDYAHLQQLLQRMEALSWQLHWRQLDYQVQQHPQAELTLQLETLSEQADYLRI